MDFIEITTKSSTGIESYVAGPLKMWHIGGIVMVFGLCIVVVVCCCVDVRIPRTKQQIEESRRRKHLLSDYRQKYHSNQESQVRTAPLPNIARQGYHPKNNEKPYKMKNLDKRQINDNVQRSRASFSKQSPINASVPLTQGPTRWLGTLNRISESQGVPIRQQESLVRTLSSLKPPK